jgi:hypothetical protein
VAGGIQHEISFVPWYHIMRHWPFMRLLPVVAFLVSVSPAAPQSSGLPSKEMLQFAVEWRLVTAGRARIDWNAMPRGAWDVKMHLESVGLVSKLFKVEDDYAANLNQALCIQSSYQTTYEGSRQRETRINYDAGAKKATYLERDRIKNTVLNAHDLSIPPCVHDVIGGIFFLRTLNLEPGQSVEVPVSDGKKAVMARVEAQAREDVKTPAGAFKTVRYELYLFNGVLYRRSAHLNIWLSDDRRKLPVQLRVRMPITIGTITLQLEKHE